MRLRQYQRKYSLFGRRIWPSASFFKVRLNAAKITIIFAIFGVLILSFMDYRKQQITQTMKTGVVDLTLPLVDFGASITKNVKYEILNVLSPYKKYEKQLTEKDEEIQLWKLEVQRLRKEMRLLQEALNYKIDLKISAVTTQLFIPAGYQAVHKGFINIGAKSGIQKDAVVISSKGLIGKLVHVGYKTSEIMLLTHPMSAVPVYVERTNAPGVLKGDANQGIVLDYLDSQRLEDGDRLLTSGQGGVFPRGINVAVIEKKSYLTKIHPLHHKLDETVFVYVLTPAMENEVINGRG